MNTEPEPGFTSVMQSMAFTPQTPFKGVPWLGQTNPDENENGKSLTFVLEPSVVTHLARLIEDTNITSVAQFVNNAVSIYGQMLMAAKDGYTVPVLVNPETSDIIPIHTTAE